MEIEKIREIAKYLEIDELNCRACGSLNSIDQVNIEVSHDKRDNPLGGAYCPDCSAWIKWLPLSKVERIWFRGSMHEIPSFDTSLLFWFINNDTLKTDKIRLAVLDELRIRLEKQPDKLAEVNERAERIETERKEAERADDRQLAEYLKKVRECQDKIVAEYATLDYFAMLDLEKRIKWLNRRIEKLQKSVDSRTRENAN